MALKQGVKRQVNKNNATRIKMLKRSLLKTEKAPSYFTQLIEETPAAGKKSHKQKGLKNKSVAK